MLNFDCFEVLTFDCYGTLVDWNTGILGGLRPVLEAHGVVLEDAEILKRYAALEVRVEAGPYQKYRDVLTQVARELLESVGVNPTPEEAACLVTSFDNWRPFPDTVVALQALKQKYRLGVISNVDDDLFALTAQHLEVPFDYLITAAQVGSYKPSHRNFQVALERIGLPQERILHVAQSLYHDIAPTHTLGIRNVWVNRQQETPGPDVTLPDLEVPDLKTLVGRCC